MVPLDEDGRGAGCGCPAGFRKFQDHVVDSYNVVVVVRRRRQQDLSAFVTVRPAKNDVGALPQCRYLIQRTPGVAAKDGDDADCYSKILPAELSSWAVESFVAA